MVIFLYACIIALTGCSPRGYYTKTSGYHAAEAPGIIAQAVPLQKFIWPAQGSVVIPFGAKKDGVSNKGIYIQGFQGNPVVAARDGKVVFVDEGLVGYGKIIILEHTPELSTVYARNAELLVIAGQRVRQGDTIARIGRQVKGASPTLYFEVRRNAKAEDPLHYLV